jgi:thiol-disulfide isomerase/thioredoxin
VTFPFRFAASLLAAAVLVAAAPLGAWEDEWREGAGGYESAGYEHGMLGKPLVVYFYADWCGYCRRFDRELLQTEEVARCLDRVVRVRVAPEKGGRDKTLADLFGVNGYPSFFVVPAKSDRPVKVLPYRRLPDGKGWRILSPVEFVEALRKAGL